MKPNIFKYAKTEASQDAFLTYVLSFYSDNLKNYKNEYNFSEFLLKKLIDKVGLKNLVVESLEIRQQFLLIDILLIVNDSIYIIIENKTNTSERLDQIKNYREKITNHFSKRENIEENVHCI
ncbi:MAG: PD-(D/E)XK nuclease family protein, partial [Cetobacterium sp.]